MPNMCKQAAGGSSQLTDNSGRPCGLVNEADLHFARPPDDVIVCDYVAVVIPHKPAALACTRASNKQGQGVVKSSTSVW
jgi:hypothetical protein